MILSFVFGFVGGIAVGSFVPITIGFIIALLFFAGIIFLYKYFVEIDKRHILVVITIAIIGIACGVGRVYLSDLYSKSQLDKFAGQKISVEGIIVSEPDVRETNTKLTVRIDRMLEAKPSANADGRPTQTKSGFREKILVSVPIYPEFKYGDEVNMTVTLQEPTEIESEDGRSFDYKGYLRARGIWYTSRYTTITLVSGGHGSVIKDLLFKTKHAFTNSINSVLPEPQSSLLAGLLLGTKQSLGKELLSEFQKTGVSHIVVLSGYNIAIVASSIMSLFKFLPVTEASVSVRPTLLGEVFRPKNFSFGFGALSIILFTILSGGGASAWRAAIMVLVALFAKRMNRDYKASRVLGFTVVLMLAPNPLLLAFDPSFQLSILATIGLIFVSPLVSPYLSQVTERFGLWLSRFSKTAARTLQNKVLGEIIASTIATQVTVLPFLIYNMGILSLVSLPINILILGTIPLTMFFGFITGIVGLLSLYLSFIPAFFTYILLWYQLTVIHVGANIPFGAISLPAFSPIILLLVYTLVFTGLYFLKNGIPKNNPSNLIRF